MDPLGHVAPWLFHHLIQNENVHIRPTIAITKAHMKLPELERSVLSGRLIPDGKICLNRTGELAVTKFAVEPGMAISLCRMTANDDSIRFSIWPLAIFKILSASFNDSLLIQGHSVALTGCCRTIWNR